MQDLLRSRYAEDRGRYVAAILGDVLDRRGRGLAATATRPEVVRLFATTDAGEGMQSFVERRAARFVGY